MNKSNYQFTVEDDVLCIVDVGPHDQFSTVTNNAENVLEEIKKNLSRVDVPFPKIIIYKDSDGIWDCMNYSDGIVAFYFLKADNRDEAIEMVKKIFQKNS